MRGERGEVAVVGAWVAEITTRKQAEEVLRASEEKYRTLFDSMDEGVSTIKIISDKRGKTVDYRFLENNPAEKMAEIEFYVGKTVREIIFGVEESWVCNNI